MHESHDTDLTELDSTLAHLRGGVSALAPSTALKNIGYWRDVLAKTPEMGRLSDDLAELQSLLTNGTLNGPAIGRVMVRLGERTQDAANLPPLSAGVARKLEQLAELLTSVGGGLIQG